MPRGSAPNLSDQRKKLEAKLRALKAKEAEEGDRRYVVAGRAVFAHAAADPAFREQLHTILAKQLTKKRDRDLFDLTGSEGTTPGGKEPPPTGSASSSP